MLVQGPCGHPGRSFLLFLTPKSDSPDRKTGHMFPLTLNSEVMAEKTEVNIGENDRLLQHSQSVKVFYL